MEIIERRRVRKDVERHIFDWNNLTLYVKLSYELNEQSD